MTEPKTNEEIHKILIKDWTIKGSPAKWNDAVKELIQFDTEDIDIAINEARRSAIQEAIAKLKVKGVVPDNYVGIQDAIALLEKMIP